MAKQQNWSLLDTTSLRKFRTVTLQERRFRHQPSGQERSYAVLESSDWAFVIPVTRDHDVVFIRQYRHGRQQVVLELPGGIMEEGETPAEAALRELREETGYASHQIEMFGPLLPNPGLNTAAFHVGVAHQAFVAQEPAPEPLEEIEVELRPLAEVPEMISSGELSHAMCIAAFAASGLLDVAKALCRE